MAPTIRVVGDGGGALDGLRVLEADGSIAVGYAGKLLLDQGAEVVRRVDDDPWRQWSAATPDTPVDGDGALWSFLHSGKSDRAVEGGWPDIVLTGDRLPMDAPVVVSVTPFGLDGPLAGRPAVEFTLQAWCGLISACGTKDTPPLQMGAGPGEWATGATAALAALAARRAGGGTVEVSALEVMAVALNNYPTLYRQFTGNVAAMTRGGDWPSVVRCKDGWIGLCIFTAQQWADFAVMIGRPDLSEDDRFNSMRGRSMHREEVESFLRPWLADHTAEEIHQLGGLFRVPVALIGNGQSVFEFEHLVQRGVFDDGAPRSPIHVTRRGGTVARRERVRVVDLTAFWAGPYATHLLATLGMDVIKVESPKRPDGMRFATVAPMGSDHWLEFGPTFHGSNPAKRSVTIDFSVPSGRELLLRLIEQADVLVENFTPRVLDNAGLTYDALRERNPNIVMLRMPGFGLDGPWANHAGFAQTMEQTSGIGWLTGLPDGEPIVRSTIDPIEGMHAAFAVLAALERGEGCLIEVPMIEVALNIGAEPVVTWASYGHRMDRDGNRGPRGLPQGIYPCAGEQQWVALAVCTDEQWRALASLVGKPAWERRREDHDAIDAVLDAWFADRERDATVDLLLDAGIPAAPVWDQMVQDELPQLRWRSFYQPVEHPVVGTVHHPGIGIRSRDLDVAYRGPAPIVGEHTEDVLRGILGLSDSDLERLRSEGAI